MSGSLGEPWYTAKVLSVLMIFVSYHQSVRVDMRFFLRRLEQRYEKISDRVVLEPWYNQHKMRVKYLADGYRLVKDDGLALSLNDLLNGDHHAEKGAIAFVSGRSRILLRVLALTNSDVRRC